MRQIVSGPEHGRSRCDELRAAAVEVLAEQPRSERLRTDLDNVVRVDDVADRLGRSHSTVHDRVGRDPAFERVTAYDPRTRRPTVGWALDSDVVNDLEAER